MHTNPSQTKAEAQGVSSAPRVPSAALTSSTDAPTPTPAEKTTDPQRAFTESSLVMLDFAAATPLEPEVLEAMMPYLTGEFYNPSAPYAPARRIKAAIADARARIAHVLGARPGTITFTAGATEANNIALASTSGHLVTLSTEHPSILAAARLRPTTFVAPEADGRVDVCKVFSAVRDDTTMISLEMANGEVGAVQPIAEVGQWVKQERMRRLEAGSDVPLLLHTDASQAALTRPLNVAQLGVDLMTISAQKIYGPKQMGLLYATEGVALKPLVFGGGQEGGVRSGTENVAGIMGFARALELVEARRKQDAAHMAKLRALMLKTLEAERAAADTCGIHIEMNVEGPSKEKLRLAGLLHVSFPQVEARRLVIRLEQVGVYVGTGSACAASKMQVSHVLKALGKDERAARGSLRVTLGRHSTEAEVIYAARAIMNAVKQEL